MADQSRWSSSRVAHLRTGAQQPPPSGTQQSRWATNSSANSSGSLHSSAAASTSSSSSSWRPRTDKAPPSSSSTWRCTRSTQPSQAAVGSAGSRWASSPISATQDRSVSTLTDTLARTSITSEPPSTTISIHSSSRTPTSPAKSITRNDGLQVRDASRPLGGKSLNRLALLASPSRGLDSTPSLSTDLSSQGSMDLTLPQVQAELREYISTRINRKAIPLLSGSSPALNVLDSTRYLPAKGKVGGGVGAGEEELQQILLLVRKLREALVASKRVDGFAVEVYELSAYLAVLCGDVPQLAATVPRLVLELYPSTPQTAADEGEDVGKLATLLRIHSPTSARKDKRLRLVSLYLLQTLCLSGRATRLGQYAAAGSSGWMENLHRGLVEYISLKDTLSKVYGEHLEPHLLVCDAVYTAIRDADPFKLSQLLRGQERAGLVDGWQKLVVMQIVPVVRSAAWEVARKAYMYMPISSRVLDMIVGEVRRGEGGGEGDAFWVELLLLSVEILPNASVAQSSQGSSDKREVTPDEWDDDDESSLDTSDASEKEQDARLLTFLTSQFGITLPDRIMPLKQGHAIKLR